MKNIQKILSIIVVGIIIACNFIGIIPSVVYGANSEIERNR